MFASGNRTPLKSRIKSGFMTRPLCDIAEHHSGLAVKKQGHILPKTNICTTVKRRPARALRAEGTNRATAHVDLLFVSKH